MHLASGGHQPVNQRHFDGGGIGAVIVASDDFRLHAHFTDQCAEAQAQGLPCITPALGGNRDAACPETGLNNPVANAIEFSEKVAVCLLAWQQHPQKWTDECERATRFAATFTNKRLETYVSDLVFPSLMS